MAIIIGEELKEAIKNGTIKIEPLEESQIGPGSVDLTLGNDFRVFKKGKEIYHIKEDSNFEDLTESVYIPDGEHITITPNEMILGITREKITLLNNVAGQLEGRSRFARFGLAVHVTASFMQPRISNRQVLEIVNMGNVPLALYPGTRICQFIFEKCEGEAQYQGRFINQERP
jgi:dCTP deaminase